MSPPRVVVDVRLTALSCPAAAASIIVNGSSVRPVAGRVDVSVDAIVVLGVAESCVEQVPSEEEDIPCGEVDFVALFEAGEEPGAEVAAEDDGSDDEP